MTGPQHYVAAEQLLGHAATMLDADVDHERAAELIQRQIGVATLGQAHALLAAAAAVGLSAGMGHSTPRNGGTLRRYGQSEHLAALCADLGQYCAMADRYRTASGWSVELVSLTVTPDQRDGR